MQQQTQEERKRENSPFVEREKSYPSLLLPICYMYACLYCCALICYTCRVRLPGLETFCNCACGTMLLRDVLRKINGSEGLVLFFSVFHSFQGCFRWLSSGFLMFSAVSSWRRDGFTKLVRDMDDLSIELGIWNRFSNRLVKRKYLKGI